MKEDVQLICPISYDDPNSMWSELQNDIIDKLPLRDVTWKHPISSTFITISKLPLKFLPSTAVLFKETDHPFRWFLAPYVYLYISSVDSLDSYKNSKTAIKQWVDFHNSHGDYWVIIYAARGSVKEDIQSKIFQRLCSEFHMTKYGDRTIKMTVSHSPMLSTNRLQTHGNTVNDLFSNIREGIVQSFELRIGRYDNEIKALESLRGSPQLQFNRLFLVKESLALMYQMMQLPSEALIQYEDLEGLLAFVPNNSLPDTDWPWVYIDASKLTQSLKLEDVSLSGSTKNSTTSKDVSDGWIGACRNGDDVLIYSMNSTRTRILRNQISLWELYRYVMAREFFLFQQTNQPYKCCEKGNNFVANIRNFIDRKLHEQFIVPERQNNERDTQIHLIKSQQADLWAIASSVKITRACLETIRTIGSNMPNDIASTPRQSLIQPPSVVWDDLNLPCLHHLSELLQQAANKLVLLSGGEKQYHMISHNISVSLRSWDDFDRLRNENSMLARILKSENFDDNSESTVELGTAADLIDDNRSYGLEEILARISRRIRHIALNNSNGRRRRTRTNTLSNTESVVLASSPMSSSFPWMEQNRPRMESDATPSKLINDDWKISQTIEDDVLDSPSKRSVLSEDTSAMPWKRDYQAVVELFCVLSEIHTLQTRRRMSARDNCIIADTLLISGNFPRSIEYYCYAIDSMTFRRENISTARLFPSPYRLGYDEDEITTRIRNVILSDEVNNEWIDQKHSILRKLLLGTRALNNKISYLLVAVELLNSKYYRRNTVSWNTLIDNYYDVNVMHDIEMMAILTEEKAETLKKLRTSIRFPQYWNSKGHPLKFYDVFEYDMTNYFKINASFGRLQSCMKGCELVCEDYLIGESSVPLLTANYQTGSLDDLIIDVELISLLYHPITATNIEIVFRSFSHEVHVVKHLINSSETIISDGYIKVDDESDWLVGETVNRDSTLTIVPGSQSISFLLRPKVVGEFTVTYMNIRLGNSVLFRCDLSVPIAIRDKMPDPFLSTHSRRRRKLRKEVLRIVKDDNIMNIQLKTTPISPISKVDLLELSLETQNHDYVSNFRIDVTKLPSATVPTSNVLPSPVGSMHGATVGLLFESADQWNVLECSNSNVSKFRCQGQAGSVEGKSMKKMLPMTLKPSSQYVFTIPYVVSSVDMRIGETSSVCVMCTVTADIISKGCRFHYSKSYRAIITAGIALQITSWSSNLTYNSKGVEIYRQFQIKNVSSIPLELLGYLVNLESTRGRQKPLEGVKTSKAIEIYDLHSQLPRVQEITSILDFVDQSPEMTLFPDEDYYFSLRINFTEEFSPYASAQSAIENFESYHPSTITFLYNRKQTARCSSIDDVCDSSSSLIEAWSDFRAFNLMVELTLTAKDISIQSAVLGVTRTIEYTLFFINHNDIVHPDAKVIISVQLMHSVSWMCVGRNKISCEATFTGNNAKISFEYECVPVEVGNIILPSIQVRYWFDEMTDEGVVDIIAPLSDPCIVSDETCVNNHGNSSVTLSRLLYNQ